MIHPLPKITYRKKNKIISKGIKIYHSYYKPKHAASPRSAIEKAYLDAVSSYFSEFRGSEAPVSSILCWKRIPLSSSYAFQRCIGSFSPENGVGIRVTNGETHVTFDSQLWKREATLRRRFDIQMRLQKEMKDHHAEIDDDDDSDDDDVHDVHDVHDVVVDDDDDDDDDVEDKETATSYERVITLRPAGVSLTFYLLQLISQSPKSSLSLAELSAISGLNVKRLSRRMYQLESQNILSSSIENRGRRFTKFFQLANGTARKPSSIQSDSSKRTESTLQIERRQLILDAVG